MSEPSPSEPVPPSSPASTGSPLTRRCSWWARPSLLSLAVVVVLLTVAMVWPLLRGGASDAGTAAMAGQGLPWQIRTDGAGGSQVFGLRLGRDTLADVERLWGGDLRVTLIAAPGQAPALEGYVEGFQASFVTGKLVIAFQADPGWLAKAWDRSPRHDIGEGAVRQHELAMEDLALARSQPLIALSFVPAARLDEATVLARFGASPERHTGPAGELQLLYADQGVAIALPPPEGEAARSKALIQYVAPADFDARLRQPLLAAAAAAAASAALPASDTPAR